MFFLLGFVLCMIMHIFNAALFCVILFEINILILSTFGTKETSNTKLNQFSSIALSSKLLLLESHHSSETSLSVSVSWCFRCGKRTLKVQPMSPEISPGQVQCVLWQKPTGELRVCTSTCNYDCVRA